MRRWLWILLVLIALPAEAIGLNQFPNRPFDDVRRPKTADEVEISYRMLVNRRDGIDELEAKLIAQHQLVWERKEIGYQIGKPQILDETDAQWKVAIPSEFSINQNRRPPDFVTCVDKVSGKITCFGPAGEETTAH